MKKNVSGSIEFINCFVLGTAVVFAAKHHNSVSNDNCRY